MNDEIENKHFHRLKLNDVIIFLFHAYLQRLALQQFSFQLPEIFIMTPMQKKEIFNRMRFMIS